MEPRPPHPGPRRPEGHPVGPDEVRRAVLDAAAVLYAERGIDGVSIREVAAAAKVHPALIGRYIGPREALIRAVFDDLSEQVARSVADHPLEGQGFGLDTPIGRWVRVAAALELSGRGVDPAGFNPVLAMAAVIETAYGQDPVGARLRAAQIVATALGWRLFEDYLLKAARLDELTLPTMREELVHTQRRLGATPWPSPPDPTPSEP